MRAKCDFTRRSAGELFARSLWMACFLAGVIAPALFGAEVSVQFEEGNSAYRSNDFQKAEKIYEQIASQGYESADLYYNLGNTYYKLNNIPAAILQYERALRLSPGDEDMIHNLSMANLRLTDRIDPVPDLFFIAWWKEFVNLFSADDWAWIGLCALWLSIVSIGVMVFARRSLIVRALSVTAFAGVTLFLMCLAGLIGRNVMERNEHFAILQFSPVHARSAPDEQSTELFVIHEGLKVQILDRVGDWSKVKLADGKVAWIQTSTFELI